MNNVSKTYCPRLWREVFIKEEGNVYSCCHEQPCTIGNIYNDKLSDIINHPAIKHFRELSVDGKLGCYKRCNLLSEDEFADPLTDIHTEYNNLRRLKIQFGENCNIKCIMCYQSSNKKNNIALDADILISNIDLTPFTSIEIQGGEPLFIPFVEVFFDYAITQGKKVSFLSNGTIMTDKWINKIAAHSNFFYISLNAATKETHEMINRGSKWEKVLDNIKKLKNKRNELNSGLIIQGHYTIIPENLTEIPQFINDFREIGFDQIDFGYDYKIPYYLKIHPVLKGKLHKLITQSYLNSSFKEYISTLRLTKLGFLQ